MDISKITKSIEELATEMKRAQDASIAAAMAMDTAFHNDRNKENISTYPDQSRRTRPGRIEWGIIFK